MADGAKTTEEILSALHEETKRDIESDIDECENEGGFRKFTFYFTSPTEGTYDFFERQALGLEPGGHTPDPVIERVRAVFEGLGCELDYGDTVPFSFSLNRTWWSATYDKCIRSYGYTLPSSPDIESLARIVEDVAKGRLVMLTFEQGDD